VAYLEKSAGAIPGGKDLLLGCLLASCLRDILAVRRDTHIDLVKLVMEPNLDRFEVDLPLSVWLGSLFSSQ